MERLRQCARISLYELHVRHILTWSMHYFGGWQHEALTTRDVAGEGYENEDVDDSDVVSESTVPDIECDKSSTK
jgi:hypothetical protein